METTEHTQALLKAQKKAVQRWREVCLLAQNSNADSQKTAIIGAAHAVALKLTKEAYSAIQAEALKAAPPP